MYIRIYIYIHMRGGYCPSILTFWEEYTLNWRVPFLGGGGGLFNWRRECISVGGCLLVLEEGVHFSVGGDPTLARRGDSSRSRTGAGPRERIVENSLIIHSHTMHPGTASRMAMFLNNMHCNTK